MQWRWITIGLTVSAPSHFRCSACASCSSSSFPSPTGPSLIVDWNSAAERARSPKRDGRWRSSRRVLKDDPDIAQWCTYVGQGAIRVSSFLSTCSRQRLLRPDRNPDQDRSKPVTAAYRNISNSARERFRRHRRLRPSARSSARRSGGRCNIASAGPISQSVRDTGPDARQHRRRTTRHLERRRPSTGWSRRASAAGRDRAGQGAPARHLLAGHFQRPQRRRQRRRRHPGARRHLSDRCHRASARPSSAIRSILCRRCRLPAAQRPRPCRCAAVASFGYEHRATDRSGAALAPADHHRSRLAVHDDDAAGDGGRTSSRRRSRPSPRRCRQAIAWRPAARSRRAPRRRGRSPPSCR